MSVMLGGAKAWKQNIHGDVVASFQWVNGEPAMCLFPLHPRTLNPGAYVLPLESAFKYADAKTGGPTPYAIRQAATAAEVMGFFPDKFIVTRIVDAFLGGIIDLIEMPPEPTGLNQKDTQAVGEMMVKVNGVTKVDGEINAANELIAS